MISASLSLSLPRLGWKSTSTPRSLKICTAAGDSASEMRTLGLDIWCDPSHPPLEGEGRREAPGWGETVDTNSACVGCGEITPPRRPLRARRDDQAAFGSAALISANAQSIHCVSSATSEASTVAPHQIR